MATRTIGIVVAAVIRQTTAQNNGGPCEGYGGIPYGDENDQIHLTTCEVINASAHPGKRPMWGTKFTVKHYSEILIGPKNETLFASTHFPQTLLEGKLCYRPDRTQSYDAVDATLCVWTSTPKQRLVM